MFSLGRSFGAVAYVSLVVVAVAAAVSCGDGGVAVVIAAVVAVAVSAHCANPNVKHLLNKNRHSCCFMMGSVSFDEFSPVSVLFLM